MTQSESSKWKGESCTRSPLPTPRVVAQISLLVVPLAGGGLLAWRPDGHMLGGCLHEHPPNNPPRAPHAPEGLGFMV